MKSLSIIPSCFSVSDNELLSFLDVKCKFRAKAELYIWRNNLHPLKYANPMIFPGIRKILVHVIIYGAACNFLWGRTVFQHFA